MAYCGSVCISLKIELHGGVVAPECNIMLALYDVAAALNAATAVVAYDDHDFQVFFFLLQ